MKKISIQHKSNFKLFFLIILASIFTGCQKPNKDAKTHSNKTDSISIWIEQSKNKAIYSENRKLALHKAYKQNNSQKIDSIKNGNMLKIALEAFNLNDTIFFKKVNSEAQKFSIKIRDTFGIADTHWNFGEYFSGREIIDSGYYHYSQAYKNFKAINHQFFAGRMLYSMAIIQQDIKDYSGSEILTFQAISIFEKLQKEDYLYLCYNLLGTNFKQIEEYDKAILYHKKALDHLEKSLNKELYMGASLNNLGLVYQKQGKYKTAIEHFDEALKNESLKKNNINLYARLIDNRAYTKFLSGDTTNVLRDYNNALHIRESLNYKAGLITSMSHLAEFYAANSDTMKAILNAKKINKLAIEVNGNRNILASLLLLSKLDKKNAVNYFNDYAILNDSLQTQERKIRNKFTRIRFETDAYILENENLLTQRMMIYAGSIILVIILLLLSFIGMQRAKNKELVFEKEQQKANEEIYSLMLKQQSILEEGRLKERQRISEDLHDGVLGKIFGTRLALGFLNIKGDDATITKHKFYVDDLQNIEKEIRKISHELIDDILSSQTDFIKIVENLLGTQSEIGLFKFEIINNHVGWDKIDDSIKINFYRIIQEAVQNINKYSKAKHVKIEFNFIKDLIFLYIIDDGVGFDIKLKSKGIGLKNMKSRVHKLNGTFDIKSYFDKGTSISISISI